MMISRKNSNLLNRPSCLVMEQKWYANTVMFIFSITHGERRDINQHLHSQKHRDAEKTLAAVKNISSFMAMAMFIGIIQKLFKELGAFHCIHFRNSTTGKARN
jgi:hypothetical protein